MFECQLPCIKTSKGEALVVGDPPGARYKVTSSEKIGSGSFGVVFKGVNLLTKDQVAIKFENSAARHPQLFYEHKVYRLLRGGPGIPKTRWYGQANSYNVLVMDLLGPNLSDLFDSCHGTFSLKTVLMLATQMLERIEYVHTKNLLHRDIKPNNFVMGKGVNEDTVFLIDFGLAKIYRKKSTQEHMPFKANKIPVGGVMNGTLRYASVNAHCGIEQSRRDDLESLGYVLVFLTKGGLPWQGITGTCRAQRREKVTEIKMSTSVDTLCKNLPKEFSDYLKYVKRLGFSDEPDYQYLQGLFQKLFINMNYRYDYKFDWKTQ